MSYSAASYSRPTISVGGVIPKTARYGAYDAPPLPKKEYVGAAAAASAAPSTPRRSSATAAADGSPLYRRSTASAAATAANSPSALYKHGLTPPGKCSSSSQSFITQVSRAAPKPTAVSSRRNGALPKCSPKLPLIRGFQGKPLLVLDLDETLVHASVDPVPHDVSFRVPMENQVVVVYVKLRPGVIEFLRQCSRLFEVAVFTASLSQYADQVVDYLDPEGVYVHHRLFREHCTMVDGSYVKDLELLGRPIESVCIIDNSPVAYSFHPENALAITSWFEDPRDRELAALMPVLRDFAVTSNVYESVSNRGFDML